MTNVVCVIARSENDYINEWCHYHLDLGFSHIYLYDNNDPSDPYIGDFIDKDIMDKITIVNVQGQYGNNAQTNWYITFYEKYKDTFDWCAFFDVDEFLFLNGECDNDVNKFLAQDKFKNYEQIMIKWKLFGDDGVIERDMSIPVHEFFKIDNGRHEGPNNLLGKVIVRGHLEKLKFISCHGDGGFKGCLPSGRPHPSIRFILRYEGETVFLNHYRTKTLKEWLETKFVRGNRIHSAFPATPKSYFFRANDWTPEKQEYLNKWLAEHNMVDPGY